MRRVLLLMSVRTYRAGAFLEAAGRIGVPTVVGSDRRQVLEAANPEGHLTLDFSSPADATRRTLAYSAESPIEAVVAADDEGAILAATAAEALGLLHNPVRAVRDALDKLLT